MFLLTKNIINYVISQYATFFANNQNKQNYLDNLSPLALKYIVSNLVLP